MINEIVKHHHEEISIPKGCHISYSVNPKCVEVVLSKESSRKDQWETYKQCYYRSIPEGYRADINVTNDILTITYTED
jgi:hypothetical protein